MFRKTLFTYEDHERWHQIGTKSALFLYEALKHYLGAYKQNHPYLNGCGLHDPLAAVAAIHPENPDGYTHAPDLFYRRPYAGKNHRRCMEVQ